MISWYNGFNFWEMIPTGFWKMAAVLPPFNPGRFWDEDDAIGQIGKTPRLYLVEVFNIFSFFWGINTETPARCTNCEVGKVNWGDFATTASARLSLACSFPFRSLPNVLDGVELGALWASQLLPFQIKLVHGGNEKGPSPNCCHGFLKCCCLL